MKIIAVEPIGITTELAEEIRKKYNNQGHEFVYYPDRNEAPDVLIERMKEADIAILSNIKIDKNILSKCKNLKLLDIAFTGVDHIDIEYCKQNNISVCNASGYATTAVSELAIGLMLDVYRKISFLNQKTRELQGRGSILGCQLKNKTVGIVGTGAIGCETALMLQKLSCNVIAYSRTVKAEIIKANIPYVSLEELMERSDIISLHTPLNPSTYHLISKDMLKLCKPSAILINTARGNVVDELVIQRDIDDVAQRGEHGKPRELAHARHEQELDVARPVLHLRIDGGEPVAYFLREVDIAQHVPHRRVVLVHKDHDTLVDVVAALVFPDGKRVDGHAEVVRRRKRLVIRIPGLGELPFNMPRERLLECLQACRL